MKIVGSRVNLEIEMTSSGHLACESVVTERSARRIAQEHVRGRFGASYRIAPVSRVLRFGWFFFYDTAAALTLHDPNVGLIGSAPIFVDARNGLLLALAGPSAFWNFFVVEYETRFKARPANSGEIVVRDLYESWRAAR